jgi:nucleotide-binding universal stress UspA family protein
MATVVVGVDGSDGAQEALRFAVEEARLRGAVVRAVMAWNPDSLAYGGGAWGPMVDPTRLEESTRAALDAAVDKIEADGAAVIERVVATGQPARVLVEQARGADMLVVGSRGHGGFAGLLLGSVGHQCAQHAPCPVTIVRAHGSEAFLVAGGI